MKKFLLSISACFLFSGSIFSQTVFTGKPQYNILTKRAGNYLGTITVELFPNIAYNHTKNFDSLVSTQFYDSTAFHRVIPGFMIQGGDPNSRSGPINTWGYGDSTQPSVNAEFSVAKHVRGILSAARDTGINSANSQFFICVAAASWLNGQYSVYGRAVSGMDIVDSIVNSPRDANDNPLQKIEMFVTYVGSNDSFPADPVLTLPANGSAVSNSFAALKWNAQSDGIIYHVEVSTDSLFSTLFKSQDVGTNLYTCQNLVLNTTYYWRVKTNNGGHFSNWSPTWMFMRTPVGIENYTVVPNKISVWPNPSKGNFSFSNLGKENRVEIYDLTGKIVFQTNTKGNSVNINLSDKESGIYFYRVISEKKEIQQGKLILY